MLYNLGQTTDKLTFQLDHKADSKDLRILKNQRKFRGSNTKALQIRYAMELTELSLQSTYFKGGFRYVLSDIRSIYGIGIGTNSLRNNCNRTRHEYLTIKNLRVHISEAGLLLNFRYIDSRSSHANPKFGRIGQNYCFDLTFTACPLSW